MNNLAYLVLFLYPLVAVLLFRRLGATKGLIWTILAGYLFLPVRPVIELPIPGLPDIDKNFVPAVCALILVSMEIRRETRQSLNLKRRGEPLVEPLLHESEDSSRSAAKVRPGLRVRSSLRGRRLMNLLLLVAIAGPMLTALTNGEPLAREGRVQLGFGLYDSGRAVITAIVMLLPFFLGRRYLRTEEAHKMLLWALIVGGIIYTLLAVYEIRMAPTLNRRLYGFFAHEWYQHVRNDGYRAILFLAHGLRVAIFIAMAAIAVAIAARVSAFEKHRKRLIWITFGMVVALVLDKSLGALLIACIFVPVALIAKPRLQVLVAAGFAGILLFYPMLRGAQVIPVQQIVALAEAINPERAASLETRLTSEDQLLQRAAQKPIAGWGGQGRWLTYDERGRRSAIPDGRWVITIGQFGWLGYIAEFGLLTLPVLLMAFRRKKIEIGIVTSGLALILTANAIDLIPNSGLTPVTWMIAGALAGWYERCPAAQAPSALRNRAVGPARTPVAARRSRAEPERS